MFSRKLPGNGERRFDVPVEQIAKLLFASTLVGFLDDSFAVADRFARSYNLALAGQLQAEKDVRCEVLMDK